MLTAWMNSFGNKKNVEADGSSDMEQKKSATKTNPEIDPEMGLLDDTFQTSKDEEKRLEGDGLKEGRHGKMKIIAFVFVLFATVLVGLLLCVAVSEEHTSFSPFSGAHGPGGAPDWKDHYDGFVNHLGLLTQGACLQGYYRCSNSLKRLPVPSLSSSVGKLQEALPSTNPLSKVTGVCGAVMKELTQRPPVVDLSGVANGANRGVAFFRESFRPATAGFTKAHSEARKNEESLWNLTGYDGCHRGGMLPYQGLSLSKLTRSVLGLQSP